MEGSLGAIRGLVVSRITPLDGSFYFLVALACSASLGGLVEEGGILAGLPLSSFAFLETVATWGPEELGGPDARIAKG